MSGPAPEPGRGSLRERGAALRDRLKGSSLARGTWSMLLGYGCRSLVQTAYFVLIARALAADGYGAFVGVVALAGVLVPFASWGTGQLLIQDVARDPGQFAKRWGNALVVTTASGLLLCTAVLGLSQWMLPASISIWLVVTVAVSELVFARLTDIASQAFWAFGRLKRTAAISVWMVTARLAAALVMLAVVPSPSPVAWGVGFLASSVFAAVLALALVHRELGAPDFAGAGMPRIREGFYFSVGQSAGGIYSEIDKTMLARLATLQAAGAYGAAYRILDVAVAPLLSLLIASYTQFFRSGTAGVSGTVKFAKRLLPIATGYGALVGVGLWLCAPLVPYLLGEGYGDTVGALRWLALLPVLRAVQFLGADTLTGAGKQAVRSALYVIVAVVNVSLNLWLIPLYSWRGAAWASLVSDALLALMVWCVVLWLYRAERGAARAGAVFATTAEAKC